VSVDWAAAVNAPKPRAANSKGSEGREVMALANLWKLGAIKGSTQSQAFAGRQALT